MSTNTEERPQSNTEQRRVVGTSSNRQARWWAITLQKPDWVPPTELPEGVQCIKGQKEIGTNTNRTHWQLFIAFKRSVRYPKIKSTIGHDCFAEPTRSESYEQYVRKEETAVADSYFELGAKKFKRNSAKDWEEIKQLCKEGKLEELPAQVFVQNYRTCKQIEKDHMKPTSVQRKIKVFWGPTGTGKSRKAWEEATLDAYPKDPNSKYWDGYQGHKNVVIDEFRGKLDIAHALRWFDLYPVNVDTKFGACVFKAENIWITSNLNPKDWYPDLDEETKAALLRRLEIIHCPLPMY